MKMNVKIICTAAIYAVWAILVIMHITPADGFIEVLTSGLTALGVLHVQGQGQP